MRARNESPKRTGSANQRMRQNAVGLNLLRRMILLIVFVYLGISLGIPGVTLIYFEKLTASREDEVALIFTSRAVGGLAGWLLGLLSLDLNNFEPTTLMSLGTLGLFLTHLILPLAVQLWWVLCGFTFQGALMAITVQGCLAFMRKLQPKRLTNSSHQLIFACLFGCVVCPFIVLPFLKNTTVVSEHRGLNAFLDEQASRLTHNFNTTVQPQVQRMPSDISLKRQRRSVLRPGSIPSNITNYTRLNMLITTRPTSTVAGNLTQSPFIETRLMNSSSLNQDLLNFHAKNTNSSGFSNRTTELTNVDLTTTPLPKKPSVIDAKHLNQDASSADGSKTAVKMKQLGEERRIDPVPGVPVVAPLPKLTTPPIPPALTTASSEMKVLSTTNTTGVRSSNLTKPTPSLEVNVTVVTTTPISKLSNTTKHGDPLLLRDTLVAVMNTTNITTTPNTTTPIVLFTSNTSYHPLNHSSMVKLTENTTSARSIYPNTTPSATPHHRHIVEHRGNSNFASRFLFTRPLQPIQKVYCFLSALGLFIWLLTISLTDCCQGMCGFRSNKLSNNGIQMRVWKSSPPEDSRPLVSERDSEEVLYSRRLPELNGLPITELSDSDDNSENNSRYISAQEISVCSDPESNQQVNPGIRGQAKSNFINISLGRRKPPSAQWPRVTWPADAWLLLAEFFSTGLETAFSGFVHGFTVRYLLWNPSLGFLANSLFWLGGFVGRLPCLFFLNAKSRGERQSVLTSSPIPQAQMKLQHRASLFNAPTISSMRNDRTYWRVALVRIFGSLMCTLSAISLIRFSLSTDRFIAGSSKWLINTSPNYVTWLGGSLFLGLGIGISSSTMGTTISDTNSLEDRNIHRLQLAGHIGQMLIPAAVGYVHHLAVFWHYACVLSSVTLVLGLLMTVALAIDLVSKVCTKNPGNSDFESSSASTAYPNCFSRSAQSKHTHPSEMKHPR